MIWNRRFEDAPSYKETTIQEPRFNRKTIDKSYHPSSGQSRWLVCPLHQLFVVSQEALYSYYEDFSYKKKTKD